MTRLPPTSPREIIFLPNIFELVDRIKEIESSLFNQLGRWGDNPDELDPSLPGSVDNPTAEFINDAGNDAFIFKRLASKRYSLKPNLKEHRFIFRGQNKPYSKIQSSFERRSQDEKLISNLKYADFQFLLQSHPLFMLFDRGIVLSPLKHPVFIEMNYYGLAQHYGFNTGLIDFTTDISVAAFFATTRYLGNDTYEPITDTREYPVGVIYIHGIKPKLTFKTCYRAIGLQVFPRTAKQKGLFFEESTPFSCEDTVEAFYFRHDPNLSIQIYNEMDKGARLFPEDMLAPYAQEIINGNIISGRAFASNLFVNPQDEMQENLNRVRNAGHDVDFRKSWMFTEDMLDPYYKEIKHGLWESFCDHVFFGGDYGGEIKDSLLSLPKRQEYKQYFDRRFFPQLQYHALSNWERNKRNSVK